MSKSVRVKDLRKVVGDTDINGMFEEMLGVRDADVEIIRPKFISVRNTLRHIYRVFIQFHDILLKDFPTFAPGLSEIKKFATELKDNNLLSNVEEDENAYQNISQEEMNGLYRKLKDNQQVKALIVLCSRLSRYQNSFMNAQNLKLNFVNQEPGLTFMPFAFSTLDFKAMWATPVMNDSVKRYILIVLENLRKHTHELYRKVTSPDVDVKKFTSTIISAIDDMKKRPELHRCGDAFNRIKASVNLLENKFDDYYRESVASKNSDMIVLNFITDVSNQGGASATLTRQFREIIKYMTKMSEQSGRSKDPNVQKIFKMLNNNFNLMEKHTTKDKNKAGDDTTNVDSNVDSNVDDNVDDNVADSDNKADVSM